MGPRRDDLGESIQEPQTPTKPKERPLKKRVVAVGRKAEFQIRTVNAPVLE
jgi:hypothetical protein